MGWVGIVVGVGLVLGSAEFLGPNEERGWALADTAIPTLLYRVVSLASGVGVALIV